LTSTDTFSSGRSVTPFRNTIGDKILSYLNNIYPESEYPSKIAAALKLNRNSVRKALERLKRSGLVQNIPYGPYRLSDNYFNLVDEGVTKCDTSIKKIPNYLKKQLPPELHFLELGYPVESHGFHISAYPGKEGIFYKRMVFEEKFKSGKVKFDSYFDHVEIKYGCRDDPLDAIELSILYDLILEKLATLSGSTDHIVIVKQLDLHQDRHDLSYSGNRVTLEVIQQALLLSAYETTRQNHPLVQQDKYLRLETRCSFPLNIEQIIESMLRVSAGIHTNVSQNILNTTMLASIKQMTNKNN